MAAPTEIKRLIQKIVGDMRNLPISGTVTEVQSDTCSVKLVDGFEITDVKLKATIGNDQYLKLLPKVGSKVLMLSLSGDLDNLTVIKVDQIEKIKYHQDGLYITADSTDQKVQVRNGDCSLIDLFQDLTDLLKGLKLYTPAGVSGLPIPASMEKINSFETKFKQLLK